MLSSIPITRLAPGPTGLLHLGNAWAFLAAWAASRANNGKVFLRMDNIDPCRSRPEYARAIIEDLEWLGLDWDAWNGQEIIWQTDRFSAYERALDRLDKCGLVYPCFCSRREIRLMAGAPHPGDEGAPYFGKCAGLSASEREALVRAGKSCSLRYRTPEKPVEFEDLVQGPQKLDRGGWGGDFALRRSDGVWAYQLASVVDDCEMGVNLVARGSDLVASTPRQIMLARSLGYPVPQYAHLPMLLDRAGERLAKRHASLTLAALRGEGMAPERVVGWLAAVSGLARTDAPLTAREFARLFDFSRIPAGPIVCDFERRPGD